MRTSKEYIQIKDWKKVKGILMATYRNEVHDNENISKTKNNFKIIKQNKKFKDEEKCNYEEIIRIGFQISHNAVKNSDEENNNYDANDFKVTDRDLLEYLRNVCCEGNVETPKSDFHINLYILKISIFNFMQLL